MIMIIIIIIIIIIVIIIIIIINIIIIVTFAWISMIILTKSLHTYTHKYACVPVYAFLNIHSSISHFVLCILYSVF